MPSRKDPGGEMCGVHLGELALRVSMAQSVSHISRALSVPGDLSTGELFL